MRQRPRLIHLRWDSFFRLGIPVCRLLLRCGLIAFCICYTLRGGVALDVRCQDGWTPSTQSGTCVKGFSNEKSWERARQECLREGGDLVKVLDSKMNSFVNELTKSVTSNYSFIGLLKQAGKETYNWQNESFEANYMSKETFDFSAQYNKCTSSKLDVFDTVSWVTTTCTAEKPYVCEKIPVKLCPDGWYPNSPAGTCIQVVRQHMSWHKARELCQTLGGDLAVIFDQKVDQFLSDQTVTIGWRFNKSLWIGLNDIGSRGSFKWLDNSVDRVNYTNWSENQPDSQSEPNCVKINQTTSQTPFWDGTDCNENLPFICERFADCEYEKYGMFCPKSCTSALCADNQAACNRRNGICQNVCGNHNYGANCSKACSPHCGGENKTCDHRDGSCLSGCVDGYTGLRCETDGDMRQKGPNYSTAAIVSAASFACFVLVVCFLLWTLSIQKKR